MRVERRTDSREVQRMANAIWHECEDEAAAMIGRMRLEYPDEAIVSVGTLAARLYAKRMGRGEREPRTQLDYGRPGRMYDRDGRFTKHRRR
jgi:hypothetical protein